MVVEIVVSVLKGAGWDGIKLLWRYMLRKEIVIYSGLPKISAADILVYCGPSHDKDRKSDEAAQGEATVVNGIINIVRGNTEGRLEVTLHRLGAGANRRARLAHSPEREDRYLIFRFEAKCPRGAHTLRTVVIEPPPPDWHWLADDRCRVDSPTWRSFELGVRVRTTRDAALRIDDQDVSEPGSLQIRRLQVTEAIS